MVKKIKVFMKGVHGTASPYQSDYSAERKKLKLIILSYEEEKIIDSSRLTQDVFMSNQTFISGYTIILYVFWRSKCFC